MLTIKREEYEINDIVFIQNKTSSNNLGCIKSKFKLSEESSPIYTVVVINPYSGDTFNQNYNHSKLFPYKPDHRLIRPLKLGESFFTRNGEVFNVDKIIQSDSLIFYKSAAQPFLAYHELDLDIFETNKLLVQSVNHKRVSDAPDMPEL